MRKLTVSTLFTIISTTLFAAFFVACTGNAQKNIFPESGDVGAVKIPGSVAFDTGTGTYTLSGAGANIWYTSDEFFMSWREVKGDFTLAADIAFEGTGVNAHRKMGLIVRDGLAPDAVYADIAVHGDGLTSLQYRPEKGAMTDEVIGLPSGSEIPSRIVLERHGNRVIMNLADTGSGVGTDTDALALGEVTINLPETCYVGLFIGSHESDVAETGYFSNVKFSELAE